jgi:hypothetical protein
MSSREPVFPRAPETLSPELKAELRTRIEAFRLAQEAARHSPAVNRPGFFNGCAGIWEGIGTLLQSVLPLRVELPEEARTIDVRTPAQIKMNVLNALYRAVS